MLKMILHKYSTVTVRLIFEYFCNEAHVLGWYKEPKSGPRSASDSVLLDSQTEDQTFVNLSDVSVNLMQRNKSKNFFDVSSFQCQHVSIATAGFNTATANIHSEETFFCKQNIYFMKKSFGLFYQSNSTVLFVLWALI